MKKISLLFAVVGFLLISCGGGNYDYKKVDKAYDGANPSDFIVLWDEYDIPNEGVLGRITKIQSNANNPFVENGKDWYSVSYTPKGVIGGAAMSVKAKNMGNACEWDVVLITGDGENIKIKKMPLHVAPQPMHDINNNPNDFFAGVAFTDFEPDYTFYKGKAVGQIVDAQPDGNNFILTIKGKDKNGNPFEVKETFANDKCKMYQIYKWDIMLVDLYPNGKHGYVSKAQEQKYVFVGGSDDGDEFY